MFLLTKTQVEIDNEYAWCSIPDTLTKYNYGAKNIYRDDGRY